MIISNSFIDENRARVVANGTISTIIGLLSEKPLLPFVIPVLFNICVDYGTSVVYSMTCQANAHKNPHNTKLRKLT